MDARLIFGAPFTGDILSRFEAKIIPDPNSGCWLWTGSVNNHGYGQFWHGGKCRRAHRISYWLHREEPPSHLDLMHSCDVRTCVNPDHLRPGTTMENVQDMWSKGRGVRSHGTRNGNSRLTRDGFVRITEMLSLGYERATIARHVGISPSMVGRIARGEAWRVS